jgi:nucleoside-diphosphate-sugar epimerase
MRVLAIGATGFIGQHVVRRLVDQGHSVVVFHRSETGVVPMGARQVLGDRDRPDDLHATLDRFTPDVVLDVILYTEKQARMMVETFRGRGGRVVALSSADVYRNYDGLRGKGVAPPDVVPLTEDAPLRESRYPYRGFDLSFEYAGDYEKILVEQVLMNEPELPATVLRLPAVYGPGDVQHRLRPYVQRMTDRRPGILLQDQQANWRWTRGFVENVAAAVALAVSDARSLGRVYNVGEEPAPTEREWVERIGAGVGWGGAVVAVPSTELPDHLKQQFDWRYDLWIDTTPIRRELGYVEVVSPDVALERTVEWERSALDGVDRSNYAEEDAVLRSTVRKCEQPGR